MARHYRLHPSNSLLVFICALALLTVAGVAGALGYELAINRRLSSELRDTKHEQTSSSQHVDVDRIRRSVCYVYAEYALHRPPGAFGNEVIRLRTSGTGFVVAPGVIATNAHVIAPQFDDEEAETFVAQGATPELITLLAFFPGDHEPVQLTDTRLAPGVDVAVARFTSSERIEPLPLAAKLPQAGDPVTVLGYPLGVGGMVAKAPAQMYEHLALQDDNDALQQIAANSLVRPFATFGHIGEVLEDRIIYDAATAHGGSGGPVLDSRGEVVAINSAYVNGFAGGSLGISVSALNALLASTATTNAQPSSNEP